MGILLKLSGSIDCWCIVIVFKKLNKATTEGWDLIFPHTNCFCKISNKTHNLLLGVNHVSESLTVFCKVGVKV